MAKTADGDGEPHLGFRKLRVHSLMMMTWTLVLVPKETVVRRIFRENALTACYGRISHKQVVMVLELLKTSIPIAAFHGGTEASLPLEGLMRAAPPSGPMSKNLILALPANLFYVVGAVALACPVPRCH